MLTHGEQGGGAGGGVQQVHLPQRRGKVIRVRRQQRVHHHGRWRHAPRHQVTHQRL